MCVCFFSWSFVYLINLFVYNGHQFWNIGMYNLFLVEILMITDDCIFTDDWITDDCIFT